MIADLKSYPDYKESGLPWLGRVPAGWRVVRNGSLFGQRNETGYAQLPILEVSLRTGVRVRDFENSTRKQVMADLGKYKRAARGDVSYNMMRMWQGAVGIAPVDGLVSPAYVVACPFPGVDPSYFVSLFRIDDYKAEVDHCSRGIVKDRNRLYWDQFKQILSPYPPPSEQAAIVRFLEWANGRLERAIRAKRKVIALLSEQKQAVIHRAVTRGLDPSVPLKPSGIPWLGDIPQHWHTMPLKFLCSRVQNGATPSTSEQRYYQSGTIPWFGPSSISISSELGRPVRYLARAAFDDGQARLINGPAILVTVIGTAGKMGLLLGEGATNQQITAFELKPGIVVPQFGIQQLRISERWLKSTASTATIPILDSGIVKRLSVAFPSAGEQERILSALSKETTPLEVAISRLEREIKLLREYRTRLVVDVVTGKLDVREAAARLPDEAAPDIAEDESDVSDEFESAEEEAAA